jgi:hypothetical protein
VLANLLPGIRDLRTPLATGYIWLLTFWLWTPARFKDTTPTVGVPGDIARLAHYSGRLGVAIAVSLIAYLIGVLSGILNQPLTQAGSFVFWYRFVSRDLKVMRQLERNRGHNRRRRRSSDYYEDQEGPVTSIGKRWRERWLAVWNRERWLAVWHGERRAIVMIGNVRVRLLRRDFWDFSPAGITTDAGYWSQVALVNAHYGLAGLYSLAETTQQMSPDRNTDPPRPRPRYEIHRGKDQALFAYLVRNVYRLGNSLLGKEPELYSAYDRLIAEYEFRIGVTAPLIALIVTLAIRWSLLSLLTLPPLLLLLRTGSERRMEAGDLLAEAARQERLPISLSPGLTDAQGDDEDDF